MTIVSAIRRRQCVHATGLGALNLFWSDWLRASAIGLSGRGKAKSVVLIFNAGAPSYLDLWDPKPDAPRPRRAGRVRMAPEALRLVRI
jgi:hypothetical protein